MVDLVRLKMERFDLPEKEREKYASIRPGGRTGHCFFFFRVRRIRFLLLLFKLQTTAKTCWYK